ncbi:hypothetical protein B5S33_g3056 [[Candida] boidinii]|nr:hypothetical protein B5S30_g1891 [[Candida] boidinii]OWB84411.1 hypothetical protein B5S33_g3056 [[Candida] boidinii]
MLSILRESSESVKTATVTVATTATSATVMSQITTISDTVINPIKDINPSITSNLITSSIFTLFSPEDPYNPESLSFLSNIIWSITWMFLSFVSATLYYFPSLIYSLLSFSFSVTLSFPTILLIVVTISSITWLYIRYKYLTVYSRLPEETKRQDPTLMDIFLENSRYEAKNHPLSYLDEFLSAIKIFGYLETQVFHELTKSMSTQKLDTGEVIFLDDENLGFTIVVEGTASVYSMIGTNNANEFNQDSGYSTPNQTILSSKDIVIIDDVKYQLINVVKKGAPLSSFVSILNLFTQDTNDPINNNTNTNNSTKNNNNTNNTSLINQLNNKRHDHSNPLTNSVHPHLPVPSDNFKLDKSLDSTPTPNLSDSQNETSFQNGTNGQQHDNGYYNPHNTNSSSSATTSNRAHSTNSETPQVQQQNRLSPPKLIAIPNENCTLSIIPRDAFRRLSSKYPKPTSHIVQMILTRLYRVTLLTSHKYLGLTHDIFKTESNLNSSINFQLPSFFHDSIIEKFKNSTIDDEYDSNINTTTNNHQDSRIQNLNKRKANLKNSMKNKIPNNINNNNSINNNNKNNNNNTTSKNPQLAQTHPSDRFPNATSLNNISKSISPFASRHSSISKTRIKKLQTSSSASSLSTMISKHKPHERRRKHNRTLNNNNKKILPVLNSHIDFKNSYLNSDTDESYSTNDYISNNSDDEYANNNNNTGNGTFPISNRPIFMNLDSALSPKSTRLDSNNGNKISTGNIKGSANISTPGDLLSNIPTTGKEETLKKENIDYQDEFRKGALTNEFNDDDDNDDDDDDIENNELKKTLTEYIFQAIGIDKNDIIKHTHQMSLASASNSNIASPLFPAMTTSTTTSPRMNAMSYTKNGISHSNLIPNNNNGLYDNNNNAYSAHMNHHSNSLTSDSLNPIRNKLRSFSTVSRENGSDDELTSLKDEGNFESVKNYVSNEIEILFFPQDDKLIEIDEETPGLFYVIDGILDVTYHKKTYDESTPIDNPFENDSEDSEQLETDDGEINSVEEEFLYSIHEGGIAGYLGTVVGGKSFINVTANTDVFVAFFPKSSIELMIEKFPLAQLSLGKNLLSNFDSKLLLVDYALEWTHTATGQSLYTQGDPANGIYIVLNGRFRSYIDKAKVETTKKRAINCSHYGIKKSDKNSTASSLSSFMSNRNGKPRQGGLHNSSSGDKKEETAEIQIIGEYGQGESLGEVEVLTKRKRYFTVVAIRDSETARIPRTLFEMIALGNPSIMVKVSRIVARSVKNHLTEEFESPVFNKNQIISPHLSGGDDIPIRNDKNYRTITILPITSGLPVMEFSEKLASSFDKVGKTVKLLNQSSILARLGKHAFDRLAKMKQSGYFSELEERYQIVIYACDTPVNSTWTRTCISQGDCILLLADADASPDIGEYEKLLLKTRTSARTELCLLHPERYVAPGLTNNWLQNRIWVHSHHHIQMSFVNPKDTDSNYNLNKLEDYYSKSFKFLSSLTNSAINKPKQRALLNLKDRVETLITQNDLFGFKKASRNHYYLPIAEHKNDFNRLARILSGQAIGLVLGGGGARGISHIGVLKALEDAGIPVDIIGGTSIGAFVGGLYAREYDIVPVYGRGKKFSSRMASMWRLIFDVTYPVTSYITGHEFNRGIWKAFGDSRIEDFWIKYYTNSTNITESRMEIHTSGYAWRYIRASMSLAGLLPPITDKGSMLLDGGYIDNLTVQEMKRRGAKVIIAVDVGSVDDKTPMDYGDTLSGLWVLLNRLNPFSSHPNVPTMTDIQMRLAYVSSVNALEMAKNTEGCIYLRPPIQGYATLDFGSFNEIYNVGANYASSVVKKLAEERVVPFTKSVKKKANNRRPNYGRRNSI